MVRTTGPTDGPTRGLSWHLTTIGMYEDLEVIARLEYVKATEAGIREMHQKMRSVQTGMPRGGQLEQAKLQIQLEQAEHGCRELARIWQGLLEARNGGHLTRRDVDFFLPE